MAKTVFGIGAHKTGTLSLTTAFRELDYTVMSQATAYRFFKNIEPLIGLMNKTASIPRFFGDSPFNLKNNFKLLDKAFPEAKFILTLREPEAWFSSILRWNRKLRFPRTYVDIYGCKIKEENKEQIVGLYLKRNAEIINYFEGTGKLLTIYICEGEGWERLCPFLGIPIVDKPFFHKNENTKVPRRKV